MTAYFKSAEIVSLLIFELIGILAINIYYYTRNSSNEYLNIINLIKCADTINKMNITPINERYINLKSSITSLKSLKRKVTNDCLGSTDLRNLYLKMIRIIDMSELIDNEEIHYVISNHNKEFEYLYNFVGEIDAFISVGFFRNSLDYYCIPTFSDSINIDAEDLYHPLLKNSVSNSINIDSSILITGCNASGKSTFLRSIGINLILSQTINTACASNLKITFFRLLTSISLKDSIKKGDSYYIAEIKAIKRMIDSSTLNSPFVFLIDEVLKGTNTIERIAGGSSILNFLSRPNKLCFAATHDLELCDILKDCYKNYNFDGYINNNDILFDYKIKPGMSERKNAIILLKKFEYENKILEDAKKRIDNFIKLKSWK